MVLCISQLSWTESIEECVGKDGVEGLRRFHEEQGRVLEGIVQMVRGNLTMLEMITLGALIVVEVHAKDVVKGLLEERVDDTGAFEWLA